MRATYPSNITREQYELIRYPLESAKKATRPRKYDVYDMFCAVLYVLKQDCTWRALPHDFPKWNIVYHYFQIWSEPREIGKSILDEVLHELVTSELVIHGRNPDTSMIIIDSKSIKNADTADEKGYDAGKKHPG